MKALLAIALLLCVAACGKKEMPPQEGDLPRGCDKVQILRVDAHNDGTYETLMEQQSAMRKRYLRDGNFGNVGDVFTFCH
jgi:predicted small lipoprotein YifL